MSMRVLCVLHQAHSTTGQVGVALKQLGVQVQIVRPLVGQRLPRDLNRFDGLIVFGGPMSANDDHLDGIRRELKLIEQWLHHDRPLWGICLGAQLMARVLGASVQSHPDDHVEVGWYPIRSRGLGYSQFGALGHVYQWHREAINCPRAPHVLQWVHRMQPFPNKPIAWATGRLHPISSGNASADDAPLAESGISHA